MDLKALHIFMKKSYNEFLKEPLKKIKKNPWKNFEGSLWKMFWRNPWRNSAGFFEFFEESLQEWLYENPKKIYDGNFSSVIFEKNTVGSFTENFEGNFIGNSEMIHGKCSIELSKQIRGRLFNRNSWRIFERNPLRKINRYLGKVLKNCFYNKF